MASARQRLAALAVRGIRNDPPERYRRLLEQARSEKDRAERDLAEKSARFREDQSRSRLVLRELSAALPADSALVGFVTVSSVRTPDDPSYLAFVLRGGETVPAVVPLGSAAKIDALISAVATTARSGGDRPREGPPRVVKPPTDASPENCVSRYGIHFCVTCRTRRASSSSPMARFIS